MSPLLPAPNLYQLRLVLAGISPMIWRRLVVSSETSIAQLHEYIQIAFDWNGEHLHSFRIHGKDYGIAYLGGISFDDNPHLILLSRFRLDPRESFRYEYDFTANRRVNIRLEKILLPDGCVPPICSGGRGAAPGEEYAGALEYLPDGSTLKMKSFPASAAPDGADADCQRSTGDDRRRRRAIRIAARVNVFETPGSIIY
jgi:hypothetical protein